MSIFFLVLIYSHGLFAQSSLHYDCKKDGFECGECETQLQNDFNQIVNNVTGGSFYTSPLDPSLHWSDQVPTKPIQMREGATLEGFLNDVATSFKANNDGKLNYIVLGRSDSIQETTSGYPRIALKSPNSELWVTFNTDPNAKGYNAVEIMRWNGKKGKYEFMELDFSPPEAGSRPHIESNPEKCLSCHKSPNPRPNWDTYRAWSGVLPPRDDMLETNPKPLGYMGFTTEQIGPLGNTPALDGNALAYFDFMDQVVKAREDAQILTEDGQRKNPPNRLEILDIPYPPNPGLEYSNDFESLQPVGKPGKPIITLQVEGKELKKVVTYGSSKYELGEDTDREKLDKMRKLILKQGFYRIEHYPLTDDLGNRDPKTANRAGSSHVAFDQLLGQQMCSIFRSLKENSDWEKIKYGFMGVFRCGMDKNNIRSWFPPNALEQFNSYFQKPDQLLTPSGKIPVEEGDYYSAVIDHTGKSHDSADSLKMSRHEEYLKKYLMERRGFTEEEAIREARELSYMAISQVGYPFTAIDDPGGVKGVQEGSTKNIGSLRYFLEPLGIRVSDWSMVIGQNVADTSYSFSDQFEDQFENLPQFKELMSQFKSEANGEYICDYLEKKSYSAFTRSETEPFRPEVGIVNRPSYCEESGGLVSENEIVFLTEPRTLKAQSLLKTCSTCHGVSGSEFIPNIPGLSPGVGINDWKAFKTWMYADSLRSPGAKNWEVAVGALSGKFIEHGLMFEMPPGGFPATNDELQKYGLKKDQFDKIKRGFLAQFLSDVFSPNSAPVIPLLDCEQFYEGESTKGEIQQVEAKDVKTKEE